MYQLEDGHDSGLQRWAFVATVAAAFFMPFSLPGGRVFLYLALIMCITWWIRDRHSPQVAPLVRLAIAWITLAVVVTLCSPYFEAGESKLRKLLPWLTLIAVSNLVISRERVRVVFTAFILGCGVLAIRVFTEHTVEAMDLVRVGEFDTLGAALVHVGSMTDSQRLMVGIIFALGFMLSGKRESRAAPWLWAALMLFLVAALIINFKRGSWICTASGCGVLLLWRGRMRTWGVALLLVICVVAVPTVRARLTDLGKELERPGGRITMWFTVAPELIREYPQGIGYRVLTNDMMREIAPEVEPRRDHLHSNIAQVLVATGWVGLLLYMAWMGTALFDSFRWCIQRFSRPAGGLPLMLIAALVSLLLNGLVEYNFGDGEVVLIYVLLMGIAAAGVRRVEA